MAYYTALITAWQGATQPPTGVTGTGLTGGMTTAQKIAAVNGWVITGSAPTSFLTTGSAILNCINYAEFNALTAPRQSNVLELCQVSGSLLVGSANSAFIVAGMILDYFPPAGPTRASLVALSKGAVTPWWQATVAQGGGELVAPIQPSDLVQAGGLI